MNAKIKSFILSIFFVLSLTLCPKAAPVTVYVIDNDLQIVLDNPVVDVAALITDVHMTEPAVLSSVKTITSSGTSEARPFYYITTSTATSLLQINVSSATVKNIGFLGGQNAYTGKAGAISISVLPSSATAVSTITLNGVSFENNISSVTGAGSQVATGGALFINSGQVTIISSSTFSGNEAFAYSTSTDTAVGGGGGIYYYGPSSNSLLAVTTSSFTLNSADIGGAIWADGPAVISTSTFTQNSAVLDGGAINSSYALVVSSATFSQNEAQNGSGGAIYLEPFSGANLMLSDFNGNTSALDGGAIYSSSNTLLIVSTSTFMSNTASRNGGAVYLGDGGNITANKSVFTSNKAVNGGAVYIESNGTAAFNGGNIFTSNKASGDGGAIYAQSSAITMENASFTGNTAGGDGGAIYLSSGTFLISKGGTFTNNRASGQGGAVYLQNGVLTIIDINDKNDVIFSGNTDSSGVNKNDIHLSNGTLNLNSDDKIIFYGGITSDAGSVVNINGTSAEDINIPVGSPRSGRIDFYDDFDGFNGTMNIYGGAISFFASSATFNGAAFNITGTDINMVNGQIGYVELNNYTQGVRGNLSVDIDPFITDADTIEVSGGAGSANISYLRLVKDSGVNTTAPITISNSMDLTTSVEKLYGPVYEYSVSMPDTHNIVLSKTGSLTPSIRSAAVAQNAMAVNNVLIANTLFNRLDVMLSKDGRYYRARNSYSFSEDDTFVNPGAFYTGEVTQKKWHTLWFVPFVAAQKHDYTEGLTDVRNNASGANIGLDFPIMFLEHGFNFIPSVFAGYVNDSQGTEGLNMNKNSIMAGFMGTVYRDNLLAAAEVHFSNGTQRATLNGEKDDFDIFSISANGKIDSSFIFKDGTKILPSLMLSYNIVSAQNYETALGANMQTPLFYNLQFIPALKLLRDYGPWHPYVGGSFAVSLISEGVVEIRDQENYVLPNYKVKSYGEINAGVENTLWERYSGYAQVSAYFAGVRGVAVQVGLRGYFD